MPHYELWYGAVHRPLDARTPAQAIQRGTQYARRYRFPNIQTVQIVAVAPGQPPRVLATVHPWAARRAATTVAAS
jgi:hypothetical protein